MKRTKPKRLRRPFRTGCGALIIATAFAIAFAANYGIRQKTQEYRTIQAAYEILRETGRATPYNIATVAGMARKESSFWSAAVGRDNEAGLMQLSVGTARAYGLRVPDESTASTPLEKLLSLEPTQDELNEDERLDPEKTLRAGISYFFNLTDYFKRKYEMDNETAMDFGVVSYNLGIGNVDRLLQLEFSQDPDVFLSQLESSGDQNIGISQRKRIVTARHLRKVRDYRDEYEGKVYDMLSRGEPTLGELIEHVAVHTPKEFWTRLGN